MCESFNLSIDYVPVKRYNDMKKLHQAQYKLTKELEEEIAKRPAKPLYGEARSLLLKVMDNSATVDDAIEKYTKLKEQIKELKQIIMDIEDYATINFDEKLLQLIEGLKDGKNRKDILYGKT